MDVADLRNEIALGRTAREIASFLCRDVDEVREEARVLGLDACEGAANGTPQQ